MFWHHFPLCCQYSIHVNPMPSCNCLARTSTPYSLVSLGLCRIALLQKQGIWATKDSLFSLILKLYIENKRKKKQYYGAVLLGHQCQQTLCRFWHAFVCTFYNVAKSRWVMFLVPCCNSFSFICINWSSETLQVCVNHKWHFLSFVK